MDPIILTPRLKLTLVTKVDRGSADLESLHELFSNKEATWWSIYGQAKSIEDTERRAQRLLPTAEGKENAYGVAYIVHEVLESASGSPKNEPQPTEQEDTSTQFVGLVALTKLDPSFPVLTADLMGPAASTTLSLEISYAFLPVGWGKGYATESVSAVLEACKRGRSNWAPFTELWFRSIVNEENPASRRVMEKAGVTDRGVFHWTGDAVFLAGRWQSECVLHIYAMYLLE